MLNAKQEKAEAHLDATVARILDQRVPFATLNGKALNEFAEVVRSREIRKIRETLLSEIKVHRQCDNFIKADLLSDLLKKTVDACICIELTYAQVQKLLHESPVGSVEASKKLTDDHYVSLGNGICIRVVNAGWHLFPENV